MPCTDASAQLERREIENLNRRDLAVAFYWPHARNQHAGRPMDVLPRQGCRRAARFEARGMRRRRTAARPVPRSAAGRRNVAPTVDPQRGHQIRRGTAQAAAVEAPNSPRDVDAPSRNRACARRHAACGMQVELLGADQSVTPDSHRRKASSSSLTALMTQAITVASSRKPATGMGSGITSTGDTT